MKKLQLLIIISGVLLAAYVGAANVLTTANVKNFCVDFADSHHSTATAAKHDAWDNTFLFSVLFDHSHLFSNLSRDDSRSDIDLPEDSKVNDRGVLLIPSALEAAPVLIARCSTVELSSFPLAAYRLRI